MYCSEENLFFLVDAIFKEASIDPNGLVNYERFAKLVTTPVPDYYG